MYHYFEAKVVLYSINNSGTLSFIQIMLKQFNPRALQSPSSDLTRDSIQRMRVRRHRHRPCTLEVQGKCKILIDDLKLLLHLNIARSNQNFARDYFMTKSKVDILNACLKTSINFGIFLDEEAKQSQTLKDDPRAEPDTG